MRTLIAVAALATLAVCAQARERVTYGEAGRSLQCDEAAQKIVEAANPGGKAQNVKFAYHLNRKNHSSMWYVDFYEGPDLLALCLRRDLQACAGNAEETVVAGGDTGRLVSSTVY